MLQTGHISNIMLSYKLAVNFQRHRKKNCGILIISDEHCWMDYGNIEILLCKKAENKVLKQNFSVTLKIW